MTTRPFVLYGVLLCLAGCTPAEKTATVAAPPEWFVDRTEETGLNFTHFNGMTGDFSYPEVMPPGIALLDYDNDGDLDVFAVQGEMFSGKPIAQAIVAPKSPLTSRLFRNDALRFTDVTEQSRIDVRGYGMGAATGDIDNDGCVDLYVTKLGPNHLLRNNCTMNIIRNAEIAGRKAPFDGRFILNGRIDHYLYDVGLVQRTASFEELRAQAEITSVAQKADDKTFSQQIRSKE